MSYFPNSLAGTSLFFAKRPKVFQYSVLSFLLTLYNGPAYAQNRYDEKLSKAYFSFSK